MLDTCWKKSQVVEMEPFIASPPSLEVVCSLTLQPHHTSPSSFPDNRPLAVQRRRIKLSNYKCFLFPTAGSARVLKGVGLLLCLIPHKLPTAYNFAGQQWPTSLPMGAHLPKSFILLIPLHTGSSSGWPPSLIHISTDEDGDDKDHRGDNCLPSNCFLRPCFMHTK